MIARKKSNEQTREKKQGERADEKHSSDKSPLLTDRGEYVVVVHSRRGQKAKLDLGIWRFESFSRPSARPNCNERLIDRPSCTLFVDIGVCKGSDPLLLVRFQTQVDRDRNKSDADKNDANQIAQGKARDE